MDLRIKPVITQVYPFVVLSKNRLNALNKKNRVGCLGFKKRAQSAGLRVRALKPLITVATAMVRANCLYNCPVIPPINAVGINTANKTNTIPIMAPETSFYFLR